MDYLVKGMPASRGVSRGQARVVAQWSRDIALKRGEVLITRFPTPALAPLLSSAEALVCGFGGSQGTLVALAREHRIPAVIGLGDGIEPIHDGDWLWVDGGTGIVATFDPQGVWRVSVEWVVHLPRPIDEPLFSAAA